MPSTDEVASCELRVANSSTRNPPAPGWGKLATRNFIALGAYLLITALFTWPLLLKAGQVIPGDGFDGWQNYWNLWWLRTALLVEHRSPYFTDLLFAPTGVSLLFHTLNPFNGLFSLPVSLASNLFVAYNFIVFFSFAIAGYGAYLLAAALLPVSSGARRPWPAFLAGAVFTFSPYHFAHLLGHMQLFALEWIPFYLLYVLRVLRPTARWRDGIMAGIFLLAVGLCDWYYVLYCGIFTFLALGAVLAQGRLTLKSVNRLALAGLIFVTVMSPLLVPILHEATAFSFASRPLAEAQALSADLLAFVTPQEFHPLWGQAAAHVASHFTATLSEHSLFLGYSTLILAAVALRRRWQASWFWLVVAVVFLVLALGPVLHIDGQTALLPGGASISLPYAWLYDHLALLHISRSVGRFGVMAALAAGVLAAMGLEALTGEDGGRRTEDERRKTKDGRPGTEDGGQRIEDGLITAPFAIRNSQFAIRPPFSVLRLLPALSIAVLLFEFLPAPYPLSPPDTPSWYRTLADEPGDFAVLNLPMNYDRPGYLLYQTVHGKKLSVAYISRDDPRTLTTSAPLLQQWRALGPDILAGDPAVIGASVLSYLGVRYVVLDAYKMPGGAERDETVSLAQRVFQGQTPAWQDERLTVYRVQPPSTPQPFLMLGEGWSERTLVDGVPSRMLERPGTLVAHLPLNGMVRIHLEVIAPQPGQLTFSAMNQKFDIHLAQGKNSLTTPALSLDAGDTEVDVLPSVPVQVSALDLQRTS